MYLSSKSFKKHTLNKVCSKCVLKKYKMFKYLRKLWHKYDYNFVYVFLIFIALFLLFNY